MRAIKFPVVRWQNYLPLTMYFLPYLISWKSKRIFLKAIIISFSELKFTLHNFFHKICQKILFYQGNRKQCKWFTEILRFSEINKKAFFLLILHREVIIANRKFAITIFYFKFYSGWLLSMNFFSQIFASFLKIFV